MATIAELLVRIRTPADTSGIDRATSNIEGFASRVQSIGQNVRRAGQGLTVGLTAPLVLLGNQAANTASDLNESINAVQVVFGGASSQILRFGETAARAAGLSQRAFNQAVAPIGAALTNVGFSANQAAQSSIDLATRAADMAAVFDTDVSTALGAIQAGLRGEADPLERFGVGLSAAAVQAHAMELGLGAAGRELTAQEKAQARLSLVMAQTEGIAGEFVRTSDSLAGQQRVNAAEAENQAAAFGQRLVPVKERLLEVADRLLRTFNRLPSSIQNGIIVTLGLVAVLGPLLFAIGGIIQVAPALVAGFLAIGRGFLALTSLLAANPFILVALAIAAVAVLVIFHWDTIFNTIKGAWNAISSFVARNWPTIVSIILGPIGILVLALIRNWDTIFTATVNVFNAIIGFFAGIQGRILKALGSLGTELVSLFRTVFDSVRTAMSVRIDTLIFLAAGIPGRILRAVGSLATTLLEAGRELIGGLITGIRDMLPSLGDVAAGVGPFISSLKGPLPEDRRLLLPQGQAIMAGLIRGMGDRMGDLRAQVMGVNDTLTGAGIADVAVPALGRTRGMSSTPSIMVNVSGSVLSERDLVRIIGDELRRGGFRGQL